jgi:hypothetical protein
MKLTMVRYQVKPDLVEENVKMVRAVYDELAQLRPPGLQYATFQAADGVTFVHLAVVEPHREPHPLVSLASFRRFARTIGERTEEEPVSVELDAVGSYRFLSGEGPA